MIHPFDLQARAELAARSLVALLDPALDGRMYFLGAWAARPPRADHSLWDCGDGTGRHLDALALLRSMLPPDSPEAMPSRHEMQLEALLFRFVGADGLSWLPDDAYSRPWGANDLLRDYDENERHAEASWAQRGTLLACATRCLVTRDERYAALGERLVDGLLACAIRTKDGLLLPEGYIRERGWQHTRPGLYPGIEEYNAAVALPAVRFHCATGYAPSLELAEGLVRYALKHTDGYLPDGRLHPGDGPGRGEGSMDHFHTRSNFILGVLELGITSSRRELIAWARQSYERAKSWGTDFGWFPEGMGHRHGEVCGMVDMLEVALMLGKHVDRRYFADAERFGRNQILESQLLSCTSLQAALDRLPVDRSPAPYRGKHSRFDGIAESQIGGFASRPAPNDAFHTDAPAFMQCCNAAGARAIYDLWSAATTEHAVHLRLSVSTPSFDVVSHEPTAGRLDIIARRDTHLSIRLPETVRVARACSPRGKSVVAADDGYVRVELYSGTQTTVEYTLPERSESYSVGGPDRRQRFGGHWRGETLMAIEPHGEHLALFRRPTDLAPVRAVAAQTTAGTTRR